MLKVLDLFSGIGGFSLGLERSGMKTVAFCEIDKAARKVLSKHWPGIPIFEDVRKLSWKDFLDNQPDVICGGFPCQDISVAGQGKGFEDEKDILQAFEREFTELFSSKSANKNSSRDFSRLCERISRAGTKTKAATTRSGLWKEFIRLIKEIRPRYAIIENVANLRSKGLSKIIQDLWQIGYACEWHIISARSIGAPHLRERIWIIAYPDSKQLWKQSGRRCRQNREGEIQFRANGKNWPIANTNCNGLEGQRISERVQKKHTSTNSSHDVFADTDYFRLWKPFTSEEESSRWWSEASTSVNYWKEAKSIVCGVDAGLSGRLDKHRKERIKQLGNSVVPQIPELIGKMINEYEKSKSTSN